MFKTGTRVQFPANTYDDAGNANGKETLQGVVVERSHFESYTRVLTDQDGIVSVPDDDITPA